MFPYLFHDQKHQYNDRKHRDRNHKMTKCSIIIKKISIILSLMMVTHYFVWKYLLIRYKL